MLREAADAWLEGAEAGTIRTRKGVVYKPSAIRSYRQGSGHEANTAWKRAKLQPIGLHEARHTYASLMIAGVNAKTLQTYGPLVYHDHV